MPTILITGASGGLAQEMVNFCQMTNSSCFGRNKEKLAQLYGRPSPCRIDGNRYYR